MAVAIQADEWSDAETTSPDAAAPPRRVRPVALDEVAPTVGRALRWAIVELCGVLIFLWFVKYLCLG